MSIVKDLVKRIKEMMHKDSEKCPKCNGTGSLPQYKYVAKGMCFACKGRGVVEPK